jgi:VWFA-related protein
MKRPTLHRKTGPGTSVLLVLAAVVLAAAQAVGPVAAQSEGPAIVLTNVDSRNFPTVTANLTVTGQNGLPLVGLSAEDFTVMEDGQFVPPTAMRLESDTSQRVNLVLAIDISTLTADLVRLQSAATEFVAALGPNDQVALLVFHDEVIELQPFTSDKAALTEAINSLRAVGSATAFNLAADRAVNLLSALPGGRKAVIMLTNSGETANSLSPEATLDNARAGGVTIYPMGFGPNINTDLLNNWARFSGGQAYRLTTSEEVRPNLLTLAVLLRQSYRIVFQSGLKADNQRHELTVTVDHQGESGQAQAPFTAVPGEVSVLGPGLTNGQSVRGMVFLVADVEAPAPIESVSFLLDGEVLVELTRPPYRFDWDTTTAAHGVHTLAVRAVDTAGNTGQTQVSINVVLPPPVEPTPTPQPTAAPVIDTSRIVAAAQGALQVGIKVVIGGGLGVGALFGLVFFGRSRRALRTGQVRTCAVEISNQGNHRSRYELRAEDPSGALKFEFMLNDASLAHYVAADRVQTPTPAAKPARATAGTPANGSRLKEAEKKVGQAQGAAAGVGTWLMDLSRLLPGSAGRSARQASAQVGRVQQNVRTVSEQPGRAQRAVGRVVPMKAMGQPAASTSAAAPARTETAVIAGPAAEPARKAAAGWSLTPFVEPDQSLTVELLVSPARTPRSQHYPFRLLSRTAEDSQAAPVIEHASVALAGVPLLRRLLPPMFLLMSLALAATLIWYVLSAFGIIAA